MNNKDTFEKELEDIKRESKKTNSFPEDIDYELENGTSSDKIVSETSTLFDNISDSPELLEEKKVDDVFRKLEETAADLKIYEELEEKEKKKKKPKKKTTIVIIISILLVVSLILLLVSMYAYKNREAIHKAAQPTLVPTLSPEESGDDTNKLPDELLDTNSMQVLVDSTHALSKDFVPQNLATPYLNSTTDVIQVNAEAGEMAKQMKAAAEAEGISLTVTSGYMSYQEIEEKALDIIALNGEEYAKANGYIAGCNEHQTGLALDFTDDPTNINNTTAFQETAAGQWLYQHAHEYGFIQRYPEGKESITGVAFTPYHYRYVGVDVANAIYNKGQELNDPNYTFEEYYNIQK